MAKSKKEPAKVKKHILREQIATTLQSTFTALKATVGEKKFNKHVKKASKVLAAGAENKTEKTAVKPKKATAEKVIAAEKATAKKETASKKPADQKTPKKTDAEKTTAPKKEAAKKAPKKPAAKKAATKKAASKKKGTTKK